MEDTLKALTIPGWTVVILNLIAFLLIVAGIIFAIVFFRKRSRNQKNCPFCAETIQTKAVVCRFCNRDLP